MRGATPEIFLPALASSTGFNRPRCEASPMPLDDLSFSGIRMNDCAKLAHFHLVLNRHHQLADALARMPAD